MLRHYVAAAAPAPAPSRCDSPYRARRRGLRRGGLARGRAAPSTRGRVRPWTSRASSRSWRAGRPSTTARRAATFEARLDQETRTASAEASRLACETFGILNVDTLFAKLRAAAAAPWSPQREPAPPAPPRTTSGRRCGRPAPRGAVLRGGRACGGAAARRQGRINCIAAAPV